LGEFLTIDREHAMQGNKGSTKSSEMGGLIGEAKEAPTCKWFTRQKLHSLHITLHMLFFSTIFALFSIFFYLIITFFFLKLLIQ